MEGKGRFSALSVSLFLLRVGKIKCNLTHIELPKRSLSLAYFQISTLLHDQVRIHAFKLITHHTFSRFKVTLIKVVNFMCSTFHCDDVFVLF